MGEYRIVPRRHHRKRYQIIRPWLTPQSAGVLLSVVPEPHQLRRIDAKFHAHAVSQTLAEIGYTRAGVVFQFGRNNNASAIQDSHNLQGAARIAPVKSEKVV